MIHLEQNDSRIWTRFVMSFLINGVGFHFLLHVLPIQIASQSAMIGIVLRAVGMIYLVDLDDTTGNTMTLVPENEEQQTIGKVEEYGSGTVGDANDQLDEKELDAEKQKIIEDAMKDVKTKLEALARGRRVKSKQSSSTRMESITNALFLSTFKRRKEGSQQTGDEETPLLNV